MAADRPMNELVTETLRSAQRFGFFGDRPVEQAIEHAMAFVAALEPLPAGSRLIDLGSGGGLPGLVLADHFPDVAIVLLDRRQKRTDFLERAVHRLGFEHVTVVCEDVATTIRAVERGETTPFDVVTARGFGPPESTLRAASALIGGAGKIAISEPPTGDRWPSSLLSALGLRAGPVGAVRVFERRSRP